MTLRHRATTRRALVADRLADRRERWLVPLMSTTYMQKQAAKRRAILDLVRPHYKESLKSIPFYQARMEDDRFWDNFIGSAWVEALDVAERLGPDGKGLSVFHHGSVDFCQTGDLIEPSFTCPLRGPEQNPWIQPVRDRQPAGEMVASLQQNGMYRGRVRRGRPSRRRPTRV
jgi:hypothetical protein